MAGVEASAVFSQSIGIFEDGMGGAEEDELRWNCEGIDAWMRQFVSTKYM